MVNRKIQKIAIIFVAIGVSLILIEIILRGLGFGYNLIYKKPKKAKSDYTIFCIGESTTWGIGAEDPSKQSYPKQLEQLLTTRFPDKNIEVYYDQTIGQNTSEILFKLPNYIEKYNPKIIIFMVGVNNWWNLDKSNILLFNKNEELSNFTLKMLVFLDKFRTWKLFKWIFYSLRGYNEKWNSWGDVQQQNKLSKRMAKYNFSIFGKLAKHDITEMVKTCQQNDIKVIICNYPREAMDGINAIYEKIAKKFDITFVNNYELFQEIPQGELGRYFWKDDWHPNEKGYRLVVENVYKAILKHNLLGE